MAWGCMSGKGTGEMAANTSSINAQVYVDILDTFLIPSVDRKFGDDDFEMIFQDDNASKRHVRSMS